MGTFDIKSVLSTHKTTPPLRSYLWRVALPDLSSGNRGGGYLLSNEAFNTVEDLYVIDSYIHTTLSTRIMNISIPFVTIETDKAVIGNSYWYYGKQNDIGSISFEIYEGEDGNSYRYMDAWKSLMINPNGTYNPPVRYKRDLKFYRLDARKDEIIVHTYHGYFVSGIADISNDYETNELVKYAINLTGDSVSTEIFDIAGIVNNDREKEQLKQILSPSSVLPDIETALAGKFKDATGFNLPSIF